MKMVMHKRLEDGSSEYEVPHMPRVPRSAKGKRSVRKKHEDKQISAFDLLATIAGELLSERENSPLNGSIKHGRPLKVEGFDQDSCNESTLHLESVNKRQVDCSLKEQSQMPKSLEKNANKLLVNGKRELQECKAEVEIKPMNVIDKNFREIMEDPMDLDVKSPALVSSYSNVGVPVSKNGSFSKSQDGSELIVDRDDDENSSGCTHPSTNTAKTFKPQHIGDRRIRKMLASKFWKVPSSALKDGELSNTDLKAKPVIRNRKMFYTRQRTQRSSFKRRKMCEHRSISASNLDIYGERVCDSPKFSGIKTEGSDAHSSLNGANGASSSTSVPKSSYESADYHVKFSIKSFKVPELFIEIPETATVGSLKRTVMEAVTAILAGGLRVGVLFQGKKVRDDKQTLLQAGISSNDKIENLGFTLEPNPTQTSLALTCPEDPNSLLVSSPLLHCASIEPAQRDPVVTPAIKHRVTVEPPQTLTLNSPESDHDSVHSNYSSKAIVPAPAMAADPLSMAPPRKSRRSELAQRRIRRPFSVAEVEALVHAVEKLGTGRWRDVKIRAFDNAKHRTYVDLKDKWKTLVHTARIAPQQRRGEPVPQELLDRVLSAHAYWTQQQAKLQVRPSQAEHFLLI